MTTSQLQALVVDDSIDDWHAVGFAGDDVITIGATTIVPTGVARDNATGHRRGIVGASIDGVGELDGLALGTWRPERGASGIDAGPPDHPNGVVAIDHVVVMTPDCDRTTAGFESAGIEARRVRRIPLADGDRRQTFFWLGDVICELVGPDSADGDGPAQWWGLALTVRDLDETATMLGDLATAIKPAVQPGRRVSTLRRDAGLGVPLLFISEHPKR